MAAADPTTPVSPPPATTPRPAPRKRNPSAQWNIWLRWLHTYISMVSLLAVLFFALTGVTLNHPDWLFGTKDVTRTVTGTMPSGWIKGQDVNWLTVAEELRAKQGLKGRAGETNVSNGEADISFQAPGYSADAAIQTATGQYSVNILEQGSVAILNDLHKGRDAGSAWKWVIDLSGLALTLVSLSGIGILLFLKKTRNQALTVMGIAAVLVLILAKIAVT